MPLRRQCRLVISMQRTICVERPVPLRPGESITSTIPDEILAEVFAYLGPKEYFSHSSEYQECLHLTLVCKRWGRVYEPFLYRKLDLGYDGWQKGQRARQLLQNLRDRPDLRGHARTITIQLYCPTQNTCKIVASIVAYCNATRSMMLHTDLTEATVPLLDAISNLRCLESLRLSGHNTGPSVRTVFNHFDLPCLKSLELSRYGLGNGSDLATDWRVGVVATQHDLEQLLRPDRYHTSSVTSLVLSDPWTPLRVSEHILRWPERLTRLSITCLTHSRCAGEYGLSGIEQLLSMHRQSLKSINIGIIPGTHVGMPDFSSFKYLEELHLSTYELLSETPSSALRKLAAPCLRHLSTSFCTEDQHSEDHDAFATEQVRWMADFAMLKTTVNPTSRLERIHIHFDPEEIPYWSEDFDRGGTWPWDYLDQAVQTCAQHGLTLTYSKPRWSKHEWEQQLEDEKANRAVRFVTSTPENRNW